MVSFPNFATWGDIRAAIVGTFGPPDPSRYRVFRYTRFGQQYEEFEKWGAALDVEATGSSFWIISANPGAITTTARSSMAAVRTAGPGHKFCLLLGPGWNMIGNPFDAVVPWGGVLAGPNLGTAQSASNPANPFVHDKLIAWDGTGYFQVNGIAPGKGCWVFNKNSSEMYLWFVDPTGKPGAPLEVAKTALEKGSLKPPAPPGGFGSGVGNDGGGGSGCGLLGLDALLALGLFRLGLSRKRRGGTLSV